MSEETETEMRELAEAILQTILAGGMRKDKVIIAALIVIVGSTASAFPDPAEIIDMIATGAEKMLAGDFNK